MTDLLDLAQTENNTFKVQEEIFELPKLIDDSFKMVAHVASLKKVKLEGPELNKDQQMIFNSLSGDKNRLRQVLVNLLSNSLKFSDSGSKITVSLNIIES